MLLLFAACILTYWRMLENGFISDDHFQLVRNPWVRDWRLIPRLFTSNVWGFMGVEVNNYFRPLQLVAYMLIWYLTGYSAFAYHASSLVLHALASAGVFMMAGRIFPRREAALAAGLVFAVHPIHSEAVLWIACFPDLLVTIAVTAAVWFFAKWDGEMSNRRIVGLSGLYLTSLFSKEPAAALPVLLFAYEFAILGRPVSAIWRNARLYAVFTATFAVYLLIRYHALGSLAPAQGSHYNFTAAELLFSIVAIAAYYFQKLFVPTGLNYAHAFLPIADFHVTWLLAMGVCIAFLTAMIGLVRRAPRVSFSLFWILITLAPSLNLPGVGVSLFGERYLYLPSVGIALLAGEGILWLRVHCSVRVVRVAWSLLALVLLAGAIQVTARAADWRDEITLFRRTAAQSPQLGWVHGHLAWFYVQTGRLDEAISAYADAVRCAPGSNEMHEQYGFALARKGRQQEAEAQFREALRLQPRSPAAWMGLAQARAFQGFRDEARAEYQEAIRLKPGFAEALTAMGQLEEVDGRPDLAMQWYRRAIQSQPNYAEARMALGLGLLNQRQFAEAAEELRTALRLAPNHAQADIVHLNLANAYLAEGFVEAAEVEFRRALAIHPDLPGARQGFEQTQRLINARLQKQGSAVPSTPLPSNPLR